MALKVVATRADRSVPGLIRAPPETETVAGMTLASDPQLMSMVESQRALSAQVQTMLQAMTNNHTGNPKGGPTTPLIRTERDHTGVRGDRRGRGQPQAEDNRCRQYYQWYHSCGVNLSHHSSNCRTPKSGHINTATIDNPQGGNTKKDNRHMKWRHPVTGETIDHCVVV